MKLNSIVLGLALLVGAASCTSSKTHYDDHWNPRSIGLRMGNHAFNYRQDRDGEDFWAFQGRQMSAVGTTVQRHVFNENPDNPLQPQ